MDPFNKLTMFLNAVVVGGILLLCIVASCGGF